MKRFGVVNRSSAVPIPWKTTASDLARLRNAGRSEADALRTLSDLVTTNGPVPEIDVGTEPQAG